MILFLSDLLTIAFISDLLTIAFIVLKLCGVIAWGWPFVFFPVTVTAVIGIVLAVATGILSALCGDD